MLVALVLGIAAGALAPRLEPVLRSALAEVRLTGGPVTPDEVRLLAFAVALLGAAILAALVGAGSAISLVAGGALGVFAPRLMRGGRGDDG